MAEIENNKQQYQQDRFSSWKAAAWISLVLLAWALMLAISSWFANDQSTLRSIMIITPAALFVLFWSGLLLIRRLTKA
jgi:cation transport ATPase